MYVKSFKEILSKDVPNAGGKGASLGEMANAGIPVPDGFVILSDAFDKFMQVHNLTEEIDRTLRSVNIKKITSPRNASEKIRSMIMSKQIPESIKSGILRNHKKLDSKYVAVRSSATSEDSNYAAWAGQLESYLNTTEKDILENVKRCWASLFTPRAIFYRVEKKLGNKKISVAIVVQKMVESERSGTAFSVHPVTQDKNHIIIEAGFGLGEAIVSGSITPDCYVVDKRKFEIVNIDVNEQKRALFRKKDGGNEWKSLLEKGKKQVLAKKEIIELSKLIKKIEDHYNFPCDIEWAMERDIFYIVQSRPITTIRKRELQEYRPMFTRPFSILRMQFETDGKYEGIKNLTEGRFYFKPFFVYSKSKGATAYYNFSSDKENAKLMIEYLNKRIPQIKMELIEIEKICGLLQKEIESADLKDPKKIFSYLKKIQPFSSIGYLACHLQSASKELLELFKGYRQDYDGLIYKAEKYLLMAANKRISEEQKRYIEILSFEELFENKKSYDLKKRSQGFIYYTGDIITEDLPDFLNKHSLYILEENHTAKGIIHGNVAYNGLAIGNVKKIYVVSDFKKFRKGDILVAPMTIPDFIPVIKMASAIITDEGGITCHAAIVAREMKKPCIIGTKNATKILNDKDKVEVDANQGIIKIIKKHD